MMNYPKFAPAATKNNDSYKPKNNSPPASGASKFVTCPNQPSMDKAGNPICFKCGMPGIAPNIHINLGYTP